MKLKKLLSDVGSWVFAILTVLGTIFISAGFGYRGNYKAAGEINLYFIVIGFILITPLLYYIIKSKTLQKKTKDKRYDNIQYLFKNGDQVIVNLNEATIDSTVRRHEVEVGTGRNKTNQLVDVNENIVRIEVSYKNRIIRLQNYTEMDPTNLRLHFAVKKETVLYIDPENPDNKYLDLRFLKS